jgi:predicted ABC-type ATPase
MTEKLLYIVGGPNGAGKTTAANEFLRTSAVNCEYIGADLIAAELAPGNPASAQFEYQFVVHQDLFERFLTIAESVDAHDQ